MYLVRTARIRYIFFNCIIFVGSTSDVNPGVKFGALQDGDGARSGIKQWQRAARVGRPDRLHTAAAGRAPALADGSGRGEACSRRAARLPAAAQHARLCSTQVLRNEPSRTICTWALHRYTCRNVCDILPISFLSVMCSPGPQYPWGGPYTRLLLCVDVR